MSYTMVYANAALERVRRQNSGSSLWAMVKPDKELSTEDLLDLMDKLSYAVLRGEGARPSWPPVRRIKFFYEDGFYIALGYLAPEGVK